MGGVARARRLYDLDGDGYIGLDEMTTYLTSVFRVMFEIEPRCREASGVSCEELAAVTAKQAFKQADLNEDGYLSFDEFRRCVACLFCFCLAGLPWWFVWW